MGECRKVTGVAHVVLPVFSVDDEPLQPTKTEEDGSSAQRVHASKRHHRSAKLTDIPGVLATIRAIASLGVVLQTPNAVSPLLISSRSGTFISVCAVRGPPSFLSINSRRMWRADLDDPDDPMPTSPIA
jgi:hypothetical protein